MWGTGEGEEPPRERRSRTGRCDVKCLRDSSVSVEMIPGQNKVSPAVCSAVWCWR